MPRVAPSQVRELIEDVFESYTRPQNVEQKFYQNDSNRLAALLSIADDIPEELLTLTGRDHSDYVLALEAIRTQVSRWVQGSTTPLELIPNRGQQPRNAVVV